MRKAVVLEIKEEYAAVLTDDGFVRKIPDQNYTVGQEITLPDEEENAIPGSAERCSAKRGLRRGRTAWYRGAAAAAALAVVSFSGLYYASENVMAYSTVTISSEDAAVELTLNKKNEVIGAKTLNENSESAVRSLEVSFRRRRPLQEALETLEELVPEDGTADIEITSRDTARKTELEEDMEMIFPPQAETPPAGELKGLSGSDAQGAEPGVPGLPEGTGETPAMPEGIGETPSMPEGTGETPAVPEDTAEMSGVPEGEPESFGKPAEEAAAGIQDERKIDASGMSEDRPDPGSGNMPMQDPPPEQAGAANQPVQNPEAANPVSGPADGFAPLWPGEVPSGEAGNGGPPK